MDESIADVIRALERAADARIDAESLQPIGGGSINRALRLDTATTPLFVKLNSASSLAMFEAEAAGLGALANADALRVPRVVAVGASSAHAYLALEWLDLAAASSSTQRKLGRGLAILHRSTSARYGWHRDNTIGSTPQRNTETRDWAAFFGEHRLEFQLELATANGLPRNARRGMTALIDDLDVLIGQHDAVASLVHGDLWGGNWGATSAGEPVLFDPAVHYGDREVDLAMTRLFGGFDRAFYEAYEEEWPLCEGWQRRVTVYNLYHLLNHYNLFGAGYLASVRESLRTLGYER